MTTIALPQPRLWPTVGKLLRLRLVILLSSFRRARLRRKIGMILLAIIVLGALAGAFAISFMLLRLMRSPQLATYVGELRPFLDSMPTLIISGAFFGILVTSFGVLLQALYLAGDMDFLLSAPVPVRAVFITKLLQAILPNFSLILLFGLPVLYGMGASSGYNLLYYPLVLVVLAVLALAAAGISSLLVMAVVRIFPARRVAEVLGFVVGIISLLCSQSGQFANWSKVGQDQVGAALRLVTRANSPWSPLSWAGRGLVDFGEGRWLTGIGLLVLTIGAAGGLFMFSLATAERLYIAGWSSLQVSAQKKKPIRAAAPAQERRSILAGLAERSLPQPVRAIMAKDFLVLRRDLRNLSQLVTPMIFGVIYSAMLVRNNGAVPAGRGEAPEWFMYLMKNAIVYGNIGVSLFVSWSLISRLASMGFGQEGRSYWLLKTAPLKAWQLLLAKYLVAVLPSLAIGWFFILAISLLQRASPMVLLFGILVVGLDIAGLAGLNLAFGVAGAKFDWEDPRYMVRGGMGCLAALAGFAYLAVSLSFFFGPALLAGALGWPEAAGQVIGLALGGLICLACAVLPPWLVRQRVEQLGEGV
jgi:ABC-2 type transport system permease protein